MSENKICHVSMGAKERSPCIEECCMAWTPDNTVDLSFMMGDPQYSAMLKQTISAFSAYGISLDESGKMTVRAHCILLEPGRKS
jgi:hypothetical protein